jgi:hypothetical protein
MIPVATSGTPPALIFVSSIGAGTATIAFNNNPGGSTAVFYYAIFTP